MLLRIATLLLLSSTVFAQSEFNLPEVTVQGTRKRADLSGQKLRQKKQTTLGETLSHEPGVTSTFYGPNASRPVIRGLSGERVRILENGTGVLDASSASQDHAVAIEPARADRIEIIHGPQALLYGSSVVGGVVNVITDKIPEQKTATQGTLTSQMASVDQSRKLGGSLDTEVLSNWAFHVDGNLHGSEAYRGPDNQEIANSFNRSWNGTLGGSYIFERGFAGFGYSRFDTQYGTLAESNVSIHMTQQRVDLSAQSKLEGWLNSVRLKSTFSDYKHQEIEDGAVGTSFKNTGNETRFEATHIQTEDFKGILGLQANLFNFSALGDEAFLPTTHNQILSTFLYEEGRWDVFKPSFSLRADFANIKSDDDSKFGAGELKSFASLSTAASLQHQWSAHTQLVATLSYTERAPNYQELFADGTHVATATYEKGNRNLVKEQSESVELTWRRSGDVQLAATAFAQDYANFIALNPTGSIDPTDNIPIYNYQGVPALLYGAEGSAKYILPQVTMGGVMGLEAKLDWVRGINKETQDNLPRLTPLRETLSATFKTDRQQSYLEVQRTERASQTAAYESMTDAYTLVNLGIEAPLTVQQTQLTTSAKVSNVFDVEAHNHVSMLKEKAPLPGRNFIVTLGAVF